MQTKTKQNGKASNTEIKDIISGNGASNSIADKNGKDLNLNGNHVKTEVETEKVVEQQKVVETPKMSIDEKISKIEDLKIIIDKREKLEASRKKLNAFVIGANQFNENIVLTDENGNTFKTSNSEVFTRVVSVINQTLVEKITEIEKQIEF